MSFGFILMTTKRCKTIDFLRNIKNMSLIKPGFNSQTQVILEIVMGDVLFREHVAFIFVFQSKMHKISHESLYLKTGKMRFYVGSLTDT